MNRRRDGSVASKVPCRLEASGSGSAQRTLQAVSLSPFGVGDLLAVKVTALKEKKIETVAIKL